MEEEIFLERQMKSKLGQCALPCAESIFFWLTTGSIGFPFIANRVLRRHLSVENRFLTIGVCTVVTSVYMGYRAKCECEENIKRSYAKRREKTFEEQRKFENNQQNLEKKDP